LPGAAKPRLSLLEIRALGRDHPHCLRSESDLFSIVVVCNYCGQAGNEAHSSERHVPEHPSILFGPMKQNMVEPPGFAPGSGLSRKRTFIAIDRQSEHPRYRALLL